jgi:hypothetical protein
MPSSTYTGPRVALSVDLHKMEDHFPPDMLLNNGRAGKLMIDRKRYGQVEEMVGRFEISGPKIIHQLCYIMLWMEEEILHASDVNNPEGEFNRMWAEIEQLQDFLLTHRITEITLEGEMTRVDDNGKPFIVKNDINIDKVCDGIRSAFRDEFNHDRKKRRSKGRTAWQRRKMVKVRNRFMNYLASVPELDALSLEQQSELFDRLSAILGL